MRSPIIKTLTLALLSFVVALPGAHNCFADGLSILNVSYDPTRELFEDYNRFFAEHWKQKKNSTVSVQQSHGGSGKQARSVIDGLEADVVTLALSYDIDEIARLSKVIPADWQKRLPHESCPYTSTIVFLVRKGNPKNIKDWSDLVKPGISVITPNPKTSGGARWNYIAAWGYAQKKLGKDEAGAQDFVSTLFKNVPVLDTGARGSTTTFVQRRMGDVLITWENEAFLALKEFGKDNLEMVVPSMSILAEPPVALMDTMVDKHKTREVAEEYLKTLYSKEAQVIIGKHFYRPTDAEALKKYADQFPKVELFSIKDVGGNWQAVQAKHFADGGIFDKIYAP